MTLLVLLGVVTTIAVLSQTASTTTTTSSTTTSTMPRERPQSGWAVASTSGRGVLVDYRRVVVAGATFRVIRLRARTVLLRWHVGSLDPHLSAKVPPDAGTSIDWASEGPAGVVALFNGGFKQEALAGGSMADGVTLVAPVTGDMTIALDAAGHWAMGAWGAPGFPPAGFRPISYRQNLAPLVLHGAPTAAALSAKWPRWGSPLHNVPPEPRTGIGVDARGNLLYVATMDPVLAPSLARALVAVGAVTAMQLDINPFWPILGASFHPVHARGGSYPVQIPGSQHSPTIYETSWTRDFFVALAEPSNWNCNWRSPGLNPRRAGTAQPQRLVRVGPGCTRVPGHPTTTSTSTVPVTTSPPAP